MPEIFSNPSKKEEKTDKTTAAVTTEKLPTTNTPPSGNGFLSAFMVKPDGVRFETQEDKEEILLFMRAHPITNLSWIFVTFVFLITPGFLLPLIISSFNIGISLPPGYFIVLPYLWYLAVVGYAFTNFLYWYFNVYIVTNQRIIDIDWLNLLYKKLSSTHLDKIQDVSYKQGGIMDSFFDFGNVFIQTAGTDPNFEFESVPHPDKVVREISQIVQNTK